MENISWNLLIQIPLAGLVVFVVILFLKAQKEQIGLFMNAIKDQREENIMALNSLTVKIDNLGILIITSLEKMKGARKHNSRKEDN